MSMKAMAEEILLIKAAEEKKRTMPLNRGELKQLAKNTAVFGLGTGIGTGAGYAIRKKLMPEALGKMSPKMLTGLSLGGGALLGLLSGAALKHSMGLTDAANKRNG